MRTNLQAIFLTGCMLVATVAANAAVITVNSTNDPAGFNPAITIGGLGSTVTLRDAFNAAVNAGGTHTIVFDPALAGATIALQQTGDSFGMSALSIENNTHLIDLTIQGLTNGPGVTIARTGTTNKFRLFFCSVSSWSDSLTINDLTLTGGEAPTNNWGGAILNIEGCTLTLNRCTLTGNAAHFGGALYNRFGPVYLNNCTIAGNTAYNQGGAIYIYVSQTRLNNCTVSDNVAPQAGGLFSFNSGSATLVNTIISSNRATISIPDVSAQLNGASQNYIIGGDARLGPLADNGGPTKTMALLAGSPAINAGVAVGGITTDQRGQPIFQAPDIGAYEYPPSPPTISSPNSTTFFSGIFNSFTFISDGNPLSTFSVAGALPAGVTLSTNGILSGTPSLGTEGTYPITVTAENVDTNSNPQSADQAFTLTVTRVGLEVTTTADEDDGTADPGTGAGTSLREAVNFAATFMDTQTVTFAAGLAGQTIVLTNGLVLTNSMTIYGPSGAAGVTIDGGDQFRPFTINSVVSATLENLTITRGRATGAAIYSSGRLRLNRCLLTGNTTTGDGSALFIYTGDATAVNCTIANNSGTFGSAIYNFSILTLVNCTVVSNRVNIPANYVAGIMNWNSGSSRLYLTNSIVAHNVNLSYPSAADFGGKAVEGSSANNLIGSVGTAGLTDGVNGNIVGVTNAGVMALASYGGPTRTMALTPGSPARDAGAVVSNVTDDQRGLPRPGGAAPDIGAFEYQPSFVVTTANDEDNGVSDPGFGTGTSLREAVAEASVSATAQTITFSPALAGQTVTLTNGWSAPGDASALRVTNSMTVRGLTTAPGIRVAVGAGAQKRHFHVGAGGHLTVEDLTLSGGYAADQGASIWNQSGALSIRRCTFVGNTSANEGGAVHCWGGTQLLEIENATFVSNTSANAGSAIVTGASSNSFKHLTVTQNTGPSGPFWLYDCVAAMDNSMAIGNNPDGIAVFGSGTFAASSSGNILGGGNAAGLTNGVNGNLVGITNASLYLGGLADNGGPTPTVALLPGSPAINGGGVTGLTSDQRGFPRTVGGAPDIGAVEDETGDADPDRDVISNAEEAGLGTDPLSIDSDNDGFNDATEVMAGSDPLLTNSIPGATRIERVLGFGPARGLDLSGNFVYAFNVGTPGAAGTAGDAAFTADTAPGIAVSAPNEIAAWINPTFGITPDDAVLSAVFQSIRWADYTNTVRVTLANLVPGQRYKLQLMFGEQGFAARVFDVLVDGVLVADDFRPYAAQGGKLAVYAASAVVCEFTAGSDTVSIVLDGENVPLDGGPDRNPILNGVTLELTGAISTNPAALNTFMLIPGTDLSGSFTNVPNAVFSLYAGTNLMMPLSTWSNIGPVTETPAGSGMYEFTVPVSTNEPQRYFRVESP